MTERLNKLFALLMHSAAIAQLHRQLPHSEREDDIHELLCKAYEIGQQNGALYDNLSAKFFAEKYGITYGKSVLLVTAEDGETYRPMVITGAELQLPSSVETLIPNSPLSYLLIGKYYDHEAGRISGNAVYGFNESKGCTVKKLLDLDVSILL